MKNKIGMVLAFAGTLLAGSLAGGRQLRKRCRRWQRNYEAFGLIYDAKTGQWYFNGEKVRYFRDILTSNGESLSSGRFRGTLRSFGSEDGTVDIEAVRDADHRLTDIVECPKEVYDYHTERAERTGIVRISKIQQRSAGRKVISDYY